MNTVKVIALATLFAAVSGIAQAQSVEQFGRGSPNLMAPSKAARSNNSVEQYGRAAPLPGTGVGLPNVGADVDVASAQGRSSIARNVAPGKTDQSITDTASRAVNEVWGRS